MRRPAGVTVSAIVAIFGSVFVLLFAGAAVAALFVEPPQAQRPLAAQDVIAAAVTFALLAGLGIWTAVGLLRLRSSARTSIIVFAVFLAATSIFGLFMTMAVPIPPEFTAGTRQGFRQMMAVFFGIPLAIGVWWLIQFNTQSTKAAFASPTMEPASPRPLSITLIAWMSILGGVSSLLGILTASPVFLFGATFSGWIAGVIYAVFTALALYIGKGLLELREEARVLAIGWFAFSLIHISVVTLVPPLRRRMLDLPQSLAASEPDPIAFDPGVLMNAAFVFGAIAAGIAIWFLIRHRGAFGQVESQ